MASKATHIARHVASSSLVRSLFGGVDGVGVSAPSSSSSSSNNFLLTGLSNNIDRVSLPRKKAPKPTHFSRNFCIFGAAFLSFSADFNTITSFSNFSTEAQSFAPISSILTTCSFSTFVRSINTALTIDCSLTSSSIFSCFFLNTSTFCFCLSTNFCNGNDSCNKTSLNASRCPARYDFDVCLLASSQRGVIAIPTLSTLTFFSSSFSSSKKSNRNLPHSLLAVVDCSSASLSHPRSKKSLAK